MKSFEYAAPKSLKEATALLAESWGRTEILAGGTDLVTSLKQRITQPERVVSLRNIKDLKGIEKERRGIRVGAMTTLAELIANEDVQKEFPSIVTAVSNIGSPQMMAMGTVGGDLCQRPRCWYFRNGFGLLAREGEASLIRAGDNRYHAILGNDGPALFVSPSSLGPALVALSAEMTVTGLGGKTRKIPAGEFFHTPRNENEREVALRPNEILTDILIPIRGLRNATYEIRHRHGLDWPYVTATVAFDLSTPVAKDAQVVLGHVAPVPWSSGTAARALNGTAMTEASAIRSGEAAVEGSRPLSGNAYKIQMVKIAVKRAVLAASA